jgi:hypothetical protein
MDTKPAPNRFAETSVWNRAESYAPDLFRSLSDSNDLRIRRLRLQVHPPIGRYQLVFMSLVAVFLGFACAVTF